MCGIFGILDSEAWERQAGPDPGKLAQSARLLAHRGPDNTSVWCGRGVGLAHTRLSLVDLSGESNQPFWDESGRFALVFNGEIYNYRDLRQRLTAQGARFRTSGDTEVLLTLLVELGVEAAVEKLEGMFAFGLYDRESHALTLVRDRFGMKPIVYRHAGGRFLFASEVKALRPWIALEPDLLAVAAFVGGFHGPTSGGSFFRGVRNQPPGTILKIRRGSPPELTRFASVAGLWDPEERERLAALKPVRLVDELEARLGASVGSQLLADAPVGVLCSGGVDSSLVISLAASRKPNVSIFHADVVGRHSEREAAEQLARQLKLDLQSVPVRDDDFLDALPEVIAHSERPVTIRPDSIPFLRVCQLVRQAGVKGVLSGEASDECFLGYQSMMPGLDALWRWIPQLPALGLRNFYKRLVQGRHAEMERRELRPDLSRAVLSGFEVELEQEANSGLAGAGTGDLKTLHALGYHLRTLLHRNDTLGMAAGVESRFPFLDTGVVRFAANLPYRYKIRPTLWPADARHPFHQDKWIVRELARRTLPRSLSHRPKRAFPTNAFQRMKISPRLFRDSFVAELFELGASEIELMERRARADLCLRMLQLEVWLGVHIRGTGIEGMKSRLRNSVSIVPE